MKQTLLWSALPSLVGWILTASATTIMQLLVARFILGIACSVVFSVAPSYVSEIADVSKNIRVFFLIFFILLCIFFFLPEHFSWHIRSLIATYSNYWDVAGILHRPLHILRRFHHNMWNHSNNIRNLFHSYAR